MEQRQPSCGDELATLIWDPATGAFSPGPRPEQKQNWGTATLLPDSTVVAVGGTGLAVSMAESAEVWNPFRPAFASGSASHMTTGPAAFGDAGAPRWSRDRRRRRFRRPLAQRPSFGPLGTAKV